ncbi:hypothetical protein ACFSTJ_16965 [Ottowia pentelensis]|uniref:hypothetical protein n=1 Tax=Ottowia pentelensis TaxID=511108 RepID=UPI00362676AB
MRRTALYSQSSSSAAPTTAAAPEPNPTAPPVTPPVRQPSAWRRRWAAGWRHPGALWAAIVALALGGALALGPGRAPARAR